MIKVSSRWASNTRRTPQGQEESTGSIFPRQKNGGSRALPKKPSHDPEINAKGEPIDTVNKPKAPADSLNVSARTPLLVIINLAILGVVKFVNSPPISTSVTTEEGLYGFARVSNRSGRTAGCQDRAESNQSARGLFLQNGNETARIQMIGDMAYGADRKGDGRTWKARNRAHVKQSSTVTKVIDTC
jgi:hypothetical protein